MRWLLPLIGSLIVSPALASCATPASDRLANAVAYRCDASAILPNGQVFVTRSLTDVGEQVSTSVQWVPSSFANVSTEFRGIWHASAAADIDFARGLFIIDQRVDRAIIPRARGPVTIIVSTRADGPWLGRARLEGRLRFQDHVRLSAEWSDINAMARGADQLHLSVVDGRHNVIFTQPLQKSLFEGFEAEAQRLLFETSTMASNHHRRCQSLGGDDIQVL